jgi:hypothetical protein
MITPPSAAADRRFGCSIIARTECGAIRGLRRPLLAAPLILVMLIAGAILPATADESDVPSPLSLEQALAFAADHPRLKAGSQSLVPPRRQPPLRAMESEAKARSPR